VACDPGNAGLRLPDGFCATLFAEVPGARHVAVAPDGVVYVASQARNGGGVHALRDRDGDGHADDHEQFGPTGGTGVAVSATAVWFAPNDRVIRWDRSAGTLAPSGDGTVIVSGLPTGGHRAKPITLGPDGALYVDHGSATNSCQEQDRRNGVPGQRPCPELAFRAGVWRYDADRAGQTPADGVRWATGLRNAMALAVNPSTGLLWGATHGRDQLSANWGFSDEDNAEKPAEEFGPIAQGADYGWPYCYYDPIEHRKVLAPEYGGDGQAEGRCTGKKGPVYAFPAHWAPDGLLFYRGGNFPARYQRGIFVAFHGSWNRAPLPQGGYNVAFLPLDGDVPGAAFEVFADGFAGPVVQPGDAEHRPVGLAEGPDGALYITDDQAGRIWRVTFRGK
jgi:glucose/arabinose dehydrogenase